MTTKPERAFYLKHFKAIAHAIADYDNLDLLTRHIVEGLCRTFSIKGASILLYDEREKELFHVASFGVSEAYLAKGPIVVDEKQDAFFIGEPVLIEDLSSDPRVQYPKEAVAENIKSILSIPMRHRGTTIGIVRLYHHQTIALHEEDLDSICVLTELLGVVVENNGLRNFVDGVAESMSRLPLSMLERLR